MTHENADTMINCEIPSTETAKNRKSNSTFVFVTNWTAGDRTSNKKSYLYIISLANTGNTLRWLKKSAKEVCFMWSLMHEMGHIIWLNYVTWNILHSMTFWAIPRKSFWNTISPRLPIDSIIPQILTWVHDRTKIIPKERENLKCNLIHFFRKCPCIWTKGFHNKDLWNHHYV